MAITNLLALEKLNSSIIFVTYHHAFVVAAIFEKAIFKNFLVAARFKAGFFFGFLCFESFEERKAESLLELFLENIASPLDEVL